MTGSTSSTAHGGSAAENIRRGLVRFAGPSILAIEVALVVALAVFVAKIVWLAIEPGGAVSLPQPLVQSPRAAADESRRALVGDPTLLVTRNPFARGAEPVADVPDAPETKLNLVLKGVRASANGTGVAMIVMPNNRLHIFAPGETILDGVVLDRVYGDRVTLRKDDQIEALLMASGGDRLAVLSNPGDSADPVRQTSSGQGRDDALISTTATSFLTNLVINPVHRGQDFIGYEVGSRGDVDLLEQSGLQAGDIIVAIDGVPVGTSAPGDLAMRLASSTTVHLRIDRGGRQIDQTFTLPENP